MHGEVAAESGTTMSEAANRTSGRFSLGGSLSMSRLSLGSRISLASRMSLGAEGAVPGRDRGPHGEILAAVSPIEESPTSFVASPTPYESCEERSPSDPQLPPPPTVRSPARTAGVPGDAEAGAAAGGVVDPRVSTTSVHASRTLQEEREAPYGADMRNDTDALAVEASADNDQAGHAVDLSAAEESETDVAPSATAVPDAADLVNILTLSSPQSDDAAEAPVFAADVEPKAEVLAAPEEQASCATRADNWS